jgi:2,4-dienoyl-CoA reductase-like NADH-dependent reductase (Old Yellow Enzyme family)
MAIEPRVLTSPFRAPCGATVPNRLGKAAMTEGLSPDGLPNVEHERLYRSWSQCGVGLMLTGNVQIDRQHLERPGNVVLDAEPDASTRAAFGRWASAAKEGGARIWMQLSHAGRQTPSLINAHPFAPSAVALKGYPGRFGAPREMPEAEIERAILGFARAARVARDCGFDGVQIHSAHGYLLSSFLSPMANVRGDQWGGPLENRARLLLRTVEATRAAVGSDFPVSVKLNSADFQLGGFDFEEAITLAGWLDDAKVDLLEISGGNYEQPSMAGAPGGPPMRASTRAREAYFLDFAKAMLPGRTPPLMVTGGFRSTVAMIEAIEAGVAIVGIARPLCAELDGPVTLLACDRSELARFEETLFAQPYEATGGEAGPGELPEAFAVIAWFYQQLRRLGRGAAPDLGLGAYQAYLDERRDDAALAPPRRDLERP